MINIYGIILQVQEYKENDGIVTLFCENEIVTFLAKGILKSTSKNRTLCQPFSYVHISLRTSHGLPILIHGKTIHYYYNLQENLIVQSLFFVLRDCILKIKKSSSLYNVFLTTLESFHNEKVNAYTWACICLKIILEQEGIAPYTKGCVSCKTTSNLETISLQDGGFLCTRCNHHVHNRFTKEELIKFYSLFKVSPKQFQEFSDLYIFSIDDFIYLANWFEYYTQISMSSISFLKSIR